MGTKEYAVTGMTCGHCAASVRREVMAIADVKDATIDASAGSLVVTSNGEIDDVRVLQAVADAGYTAEPRP